MTKKEVRKGKIESRCEVWTFASLKTSEVETDPTPVMVLPGEGFGEWLGQEAGLPLGGAVRALITCLSYGDPVTVMKLNYLFTDVLVWNMLNDWIEPYNNNSTFKSKI